MKVDQCNTPANNKFHDARCRNLFLVQNRSYWRSCPFHYDKDVDMILTYDFGVFKEIEKMGGMVAFLDHLVDPEVMEKYNHETYDFFARWHYDEQGNDIFAYKGIKIGNAFRIAIWSNITQYVRTFINLLAVRNIKCEKIIAGIEDVYTLDILKILNLEMETWEPKGNETIQNYYFPILKWIDEQIFPYSIKQAVKCFLTWTYDLIFSIVDHIFSFRKKSTRIFIQPYHPTVKIIEQLKKNPAVSVILENYTWTKGLSKERRLAVSGSSHRYQKLGDEMVKGFDTRRSVKWNIEGFPLSEYLYPIIIKRISGPLVECLKTVDSLLKYFKTRKLDLMISFANIGFVNCLMLNYCHYQGIPTYLVINGLLANSYLDEAKDAKWINSYGESIRDNYFRGMKNIVCLGDPRMDGYVNDFKLKQIDREKPTIVIGTSGFSNIDLNSYVATEFYFLHDVMSACHMLQARGRQMEIVLKVRPNGYIEQYRSFLQEYFPEMTVVFYDRTPMKEVLLKADYLITIYSQTLFEASCLGIPVLYYKKDIEDYYPPFDGKSELVTAVSLPDLIEKMESFYNADPIYDDFLERTVMEKYVGPLDGHNLERNMEFIYSLIG
ncbi:MAG: hypothetical protein AB9917_09015 [Negativicutes bacterium]